MLGCGWSVSQLGEWELVSYFFVVGGGVLLFVCLFFNLMLICYFSLTFRFKEIKTNSGTSEVCHELSCTELLLFCFGGIA